MKLFNVLDTYRGWHYFGFVRRGKLRKIEAGCQTWTTFDEAYAHYSPVDSDRKKWLRFAPGDAANTYWGGDFKRQEAERATAIAALKHLERLIREYRSRHIWYRPWWWLGL